MSSAKKYTCTYLKIQFGKSTEWEQFIPEMLQMNSPTDVILGLGNLIPNEYVWSNDVMVSKSTGMFHSTCCKIKREYMYQVAI